MTNIEWTDATWNPVIGCKKIAPGCSHCYAETMAKRLAKMGQKQYAAVVNERGWNGKAVTVPEALDKPLRWKKGRRIFVCSMSDLFHDDVPFEYIAAVFGVMAACPQHTFQVLTKRPERALEFFEWCRTGDVPVQRCIRLATRISTNDTREFHDAMRRRFEWPPEWPLTNVEFGVSLSDQGTADKNIPVLLRIPAAVRFVSAEPLLGPVSVRAWLHDFGCPCGWGGDSPDAKCHSCGWKGADPNSDSTCPDCGEAIEDTDACPECDLDSRDGAGFGPNEQGRLDWVIVGGESGPGARPCDVAWIRSIVQQCKAASVPVFVKQIGALPVADKADIYEAAKAGVRIPRGQKIPVFNLRDRKGGDPQEWSEDLRVREFPGTAMKGGV